MVNCDRCGIELNIGDYPFCPHGRGSNTIVGDEMDETIRHGLCWENGQPRRFRSKAEMKRVAKKKGLENRVEHIGAPGSDKSKFTTRHF